MPHVYPPSRRVRDVVRDAALLVLADGERAVVRPRQPRIPLIARRTNIHQRAVERREARVADVGQEWLNCPMSQGPDASLAAAFFTDPSSNI